MQRPLSRLMDGVETSSELAPWPLPSFAFVFFSFARFLSLCSAQEHVVRDDAGRLDPDLPLHLWCAVRNFPARVLLMRKCAAVGYVILLWDTLLILPDEIERVWRGGISLPKLFFVFNHYASIVVRYVVLRRR